MTEQPIPLAEAAARLGLTLEATRARVRRGSLRGERRGRAWFVYLAAEEATEPRPDMTGQRPDATERDRTIVRLEEEVAFLREQLAARAKAEEELRVLLLGAQRLLTAPTAAGSVAPEPPETVPEASAATETPRRAWWAVWRR